MKQFLLFLSLLSMAACAHVRQADLDSWRGVNVSELETHPLFSAMQLEKRPLSDGGFIYNYRNGGGMRGGSSCNMIGNQLYCGGHSREIVCMNQFIVKENVVQEYRAIGDCKTNCSVWPVSKPCD